MFQHLLKFFTLLCLLNSFVHSTWYANLVGIMFSFWICLPKIGYSLRRIFYIMQSLFTNHFVLVCIIFAYVYFSQKCVKTEKSEWCVWCLNITHVYTNIATGLRLYSVQRYIRFIKPLIIRYTANSRLASISCNVIRCLHHIFLWS